MKVLGLPMLDWVTLCLTVWACLLYLYKTSKCTYLPYRAGEDECQHIELHVSLYTYIYIYIYMFYNRPSVEGNNNNSNAPEHQTWKLLITMQPCSCGAHLTLQVNVMCIIAGKITVISYIGTTFRVS